MSVSRSAGVPPSAPVSSFAQPTPGEIKDQGLAALLKRLAATSLGLCVVTTRYAIPHLRAFSQTTAPMHELPRLSTAAGVTLLRTIGVKIGSQADFEKLVEDVDGHALTLQILGQFLVRAFHGDIRRRDRISFEKADAKIQGGHPFRAMEAYVKWLEDDSEEARREVAVLKLLGLFDRPATADCVAALRKAPAIAGLTEPLVGLAEDDWEFSLSALRDAKLLTVNREEGSGVLVALDAHPLLREYFALRVRQQQPETWRAAHRRLHEHLSVTTKDLPQPTLEDLQPLYQAVAHGCQAGMQKEACDKIYWVRILRRGEHYTWHKLGAYGAELGAQACFFEKQWSRASAALTEADRAWILNEVACCLRALGRLTESLESIRAAREAFVKMKQFDQATICASTLSELELTLGDVAEAERDGRQSVLYAEQIRDPYWMIVTLATHADALHQAGHRAEALARFRQGAEIPLINQSGYVQPYSLFQYQTCDLFLCFAERVAWQRTLRLTIIPNSPSLFEACNTASLLASDWLKSELNLLSKALYYLTLGRALLYESILKGSSLDPCRAPLQHAVDGLRRAGTQDHLARGLLTRAWLRFLEGQRTDSESARSDLDEAWEIAERGPMKLHMADIHLHRARLFFREAEYPWESPAADLAAARELIEKCGYGRRKVELEDAERAIGGGGA